MRISEWRSRVPNSRVRVARLISATTWRTSINYQSLFWALGTAVVVVLWFALVRATRPERVSQAARHATLEPAEAAVGIGAGAALAEGDQVERR